MKEIFEQLSEFWKKLGANQKAAVLIVSVISVVAMAGIVMYAQRPQYELLYGDLTAEDSASIISYLSQNNIPYEAKGNGNAIFVLRDRIAEVRAQTVERGLIRGGDEGFSLLDKTTIGWTDALQEVNITRAIQGEISKTLSHLSFVRSAKVIISPHEKSLFVKEDKPAKASVYLTLRPGKTPTGEQVSSVTFFVASAYPGLKAEQVFVMDQNGKLLHAPNNTTAEATSATLASNKIAFQKQVEEHLTSNTQELLDKAYGPGTALVTVRVAVKDPPPIEERIEIDKKSPLKSEMKKDRSNESGTLSGSGDTSLQGKVQGSSNPSNPNNKESDAESKKEYYEPGKKITRSVPTGFSIERISVSLIIDKALNEQKAAIEEQVRRSVGWDKARDEADPSNIVAAAVAEFPKPEAPPAEEAGLMDKPQIMELAKYAVEAVIAIAFLFFLKGVIKKSGGKKAGATGGATGPGGVELPPEVLARLQSRRSAEALIAGDNEGASRAAKKWMAGAKK